MKKTPAPTNHTSSDHSLQREWDDRQADRTASGRVRRALEGEIAALGQGSVRSQRQAQGPVRTNGSSCRLLKKTNKLGLPAIV
jgi:hypothetical protein